MADYLISKGAVGSEALERIRSWLRSSPLVGPSTLAGAFRGSYGLAITFTEAGRAQLASRSAALAEAVLALAPPPELCPTPPNAWYLNLLKLPPGRGVGRHTDGTLRGPSGEAEALPACVSVLYLWVPPGPGGALVLFRGEAALARLPPEEGAAVHFSGALEHEVEPGPAGAAGERVSLVLEQYRLAPEALARLPAFKLDSRAGFAAHLADHASRPPGSFERE